MSPKTMTYTGELVVTSCWCGIQLAVPESLYRRAQSASGFAIHCPLGHEFVYKKNEADRLRDELEAAQRRLIQTRNARDRAQADADAERRSKAAIKGHLTRARNKIAAGVCPVADCGQHFANVREHMRHRHPDWHLTDPETGKAVEQ